MLRGYLRLIVFALGLLAGVQVPGFVDQYQKRVSAHYEEAVRSFSGFQHTADQYFGGSVEALIAHHASSTDPVFHAESSTIAALYARLQALRTELAALTGTLLRRLLHVAFAADAGLLHETVMAYSYTVPLTGDAIVCGVTAGFGLALLIESLLVGGFRLARRQLLRMTSTRTSAVDPLKRRREPSLAIDVGTTDSTPSADAARPRARRG
jgi:hypothetical protein